jgi:hypothetical protein
MVPWFCHRWLNCLCRKHTTRLVAIFIASKTWHSNGAGHGGGNLGNKVTHTFPLFFSKLNRIAWHVNMPGGRALSAHKAGKLIVKTDGQTKTEKRRVCKIVWSGNNKLPFLTQPDLELWVVSNLACAWSFRTQVFLCFDLNTRLWNNKSKRKYSMLVEEWQHKSFIYKMKLPQNEDLSSLCSLIPMEHQSITGLLLRIGINHII